jgi:hypothetical protein
VPDAGQLVQSTFEDVAQGYEQIEADAPRSLRDDAVDLLPGQLDAAVGQRADEGRWSGTGRGWP